MKPTIDLLDRRDDGHLAAHVLERLAFEGRLAASDGPRADALRSAEAHVEACAACRDAIAALRADHAAFLARRPVDGFFTELARVDGPAPVPLRAARSPWRFAAPIAALAAALAAIVIFAPGRGDDPASLARDGVTLRGATTSRPPVTLQLHVSRGGAPAVAARPSEVLHPGDVLRFTAMLPEHGYVFIANVDANGRVSRYFPENSPRSAEVPRGLPRTLPGSIELDDFIGLERITLLSSDGPLDEADVFAALARAYERAGGDLTRMAAPALDAAEHAVVIRKAPKAAP